MKKTLKCSKCGTTEANTYHGTEVETDYLFFTRKKMVYLCDDCKFRRNEKE